MPTVRSVLSVGVEEEFFVFDPADRRLARGGLPGLATLQKGYDAIAGFDNEFQLAIVESRTDVCESLATVRASLSQLRQRLRVTAEADRLDILACGTMPLADWRRVPVTSKPRYDEICGHYGDVVRQRLTCGCHVHVGVSDGTWQFGLLSRVQAWLPSLLALSASSPFNESNDTGYQSSRHLLWGGFPVAGQPGEFASYAEYAARIEGLIASGAILDAGHVYWDARLGTNYETLEFRIADACTTVDEVVLQVALCRALVSTCSRAVDRESGHRRGARSSLPSGQLACGEIRTPGDSHRHALWARGSGLAGDLEDAGSTSASAGGRRGLGRGHCAGRAASSQRQLRATATAGIGRIIEPGACRRPLGRGDSAVVDLASGARVESGLMTESLRRTKPPGFCGPQPAMLCFIEVLVS